MIDNTFLGIQMLYGAFWLFNGLNGFFRWQPIPHISKEIDAVTEVFVKSEFLMLTVKIIELIVGLTFITNQFSFIGLLILTPVLYGICGLHLKYNPKPWGILAVLLVPFSILVLKHQEFLLRLS